MSTALILGPVRLDTRSVVRFSVTDGWQYPDHDVVETKPKLQWTGTQLRSASIGLCFHMRWCDPAAEMAALHGLGGAVRAWPLMRGTGAWLGRFVVTNLSETDRWTTPDGAPLWVEADLKLTEWAGQPLTGIGPALVRAIATPLLRRLR
ncbi:phage tail protein [Azospirillum halopraeferens]|uniref:phage tail protein n=1 Tax=Azospirillum halopraeferens TaxID=34010 RepID=UPI000427E38B|nr:phage tail protein [Azospirillum halopraeferens]